MNDMPIFRILLTDGTIVSVDADTLDCKDGNEFVFYKNGVSGKMEIARYDKKLNLQNIALPGFEFRISDGRWMVSGKE